MQEFGQSKKENVDYVVRSASDKLDGTEDAGRNNQDLQLRQMLLVL